MALHRDSALVTPHYRLYRYDGGGEGRVSSLQEPGVPSADASQEASEVTAPHRPGYPVLLVHGLMGHSRTWQDHLAWADQAAASAGLGNLYLYDQPYHTGGPYRPELPAAAVAGQPRIYLDSLPDISTDFFTEQLGQAVRQVLNRTGARRVVLVGHSMGSLHSWCVAARWPQLVAGVVVEDMSPDFRGLTTVLYDGYYDSWPTTFHRSTFTDMFGEVAGRYFRRSFDRHLPASGHVQQEGDGSLTAVKERGETLWTLHGYMEIYTAIANYWGEHDSWGEWEAVTCPVLLLKAADGVTQGDTMEEMAARNLQALPLVYATTPGHVIHDVEPALYRRHVAEFLQLTAKFSG